MDVKGRWIGKRTRWWIDKILREEVGVAAGFGLGVDIGCESRVEGEEGSKIINVGCSRDLLLDCVCTGAGVINQDSFNAVVFGIVGVQHGVCNVWNIITGIALPGDIDLLVV